MLSAWPEMRIYNMCQRVHVLRDRSREHAAQACSLRRTRALPTGELELRGASGAVQAQEGLHALSPVAG